MKIKCKQCDDILDGNKNKLKEKGYKDLTSEKTLEEVINDLNKLENK